MTAPVSVIVSGARTPIGRLLGGLKSLSGSDLGAIAIRADRTFRMMAALAAGSALAIAGCSSNEADEHLGHSGHSAESSGMHAGMNHGGAGEFASENGFTLTPVESAAEPNVPVTYRFQIVGSDGKVVTGFTPEQTQFMHLYVIRQDLAGYQHLHPTLDPDGTWSTVLAPMAPGVYRIYTQFVANAGGRSATSLLSVPFSVHGEVVDKPLPPPSTTAEVDGYVLAIKELSPNALRVTLSKDGRPVTDIEPYLDSYAHVTAVHASDLALAHLHPEGTVHGNNGGPDLRFHSTLNKSGLWRIFVQFQTAGILHTAAITVAR